MLQKVRRKKMETLIRLKMDGTHEISRNLYRMYTSIPGPNYNVHKPNKYPHLDRDGR